MNKKVTTIGIGAAVVSAFAVFEWQKPPVLLQAPEPNESLSVSPQEFTKAMAKGSDSKERFLLVYHPAEQKTYRPKPDGLGSYVDTPNEEAVQAVVVRPGTVAGFTDNTVTFDGWVRPTSGTPTAVQIVNDDGTLAGSLGHKDDPAGVLNENIRRALAQQHLANNQDLLGKKMDEIHKTIDECTANDQKSFQQGLSPAAARAEQRAVNKHTEGVKRHSMIGRSRGRRRGK